MTTLADRSSGKTRGLHIPYRESVLTWLLRESLGGNARTFMVAAVSPASDNFEETLSTLRYANQAKKIVNTAVVNEDATATMLRQLNEEIEQLRLQLAKVGDRRESNDELPDESELVQRLLESEKLVETLNETWEDKLIKTREMQELRMERLRDHGILLAEGDDDDDVPLGVMAPRSIPFLLNLNPMSTQCLVYYLKEGVTTVGSGYDNLSDQERDDDTAYGGAAAADSPLDSPPVAATRGITLQARNVLPHHCDFVCAELPGDFYELAIPVVLMRPRPGAKLLLNGRTVLQEVRLRTGDKITIGDVTFCFTNPEEARVSPPVPSPDAGPAAFMPPDTESETDGSGADRVSPRRTKKRRAVAPLDDVLDGDGAGGDDDSSSPPTPISPWRPDDEDGSASAHPSMAASPREQLTSPSSLSPALSDQMRQDNERLQQETLKLQQEADERQRALEDLQTRQRLEAEQLQREAELRRQELEELRRQQLELDQQREQERVRERQEQEQLRREELERQQREMERVQREQQELQERQQQEHAQQMLLMQQQLQAMQQQLQLQQEEQARRRQLEAERQQAKADQEKDDEEEAAERRSKEQDQQPETPAQASSPASDLDPEERLRLAEEAEEEERYRQLMAAREAEELEARAAAEDSGEDQEDADQAQPSTAPKHLRLSPVGAATSEPDTEDTEAAGRQLQQRLELLREQAIFEYDICKEYPMLVHFTTQAHHNRFEYALAPAFALYMMTRYRQRISGPEELRAFLGKLALMVKQATTHARKRRSIRFLGMWLANASELLMAIRHDESLVATSGDAQVRLNEVVQEALSALVSETKARVKPAVPAMLQEQGVFTLQFQERDMATSPEHGMQYVIESLDALCTCLRDAQVNTSLIQSLFSSVFYYLGAMLFNEFITTKDRDMYTWDRGLVARFNMQLLSDWAISRKLPFGAYLTHVVQASQLLQTNKSSLEHLDAIAETCNQLNSLQLEHILKRYKAQSDEKPIPAVLIDCLKARAMATTDKACLDDESVNCSVQLLRNPHYLLPFRLTTTTYHFEEKLVCWWCCQ